ncbi:putative invasin [hydrothermal vent metagenome]|uniref:Putative invasin n=1 Tax=hydrothermal vent metagenome TaxID=652676 RepID=A0A1W1BK40_9ZZZZ
MKRNSIYAFIIAIGLMLSACGSNSRPDGGEVIIGKNLFKATPVAIALNNLDFNTRIPFTKDIDKDVRLEFKNFKLELEGCDIDNVSFTPDPLILDGSKGSQKSLAIIGKVTNDCIPTAYSLTADKTITQGSKSKTITGENILSTKVDANGNPVVSIDPNNPVVDGNFSFYNVPSSIVIDKAAKEYPIKIQLIDNALKGVSGKTVQILAYDVRYGEISDMTVTTDSNGFANFIYTSPDDIAPINGDTLPLTVVFDDNGTRIDSANITLSFNASSTTPNSYNFMNATSITVTAASQEQTITVDLVDSAGSGVSGKSVKATVLPIAFGSLTPTTATTDDAGRATFNYTAPSDLTNINGQSQNINLMFTDENDNTIAATATIAIQSSAVGGTTYRLINETTPVTITHADQVETISVNIVDSGNVGVSGKIVTLSTPSFGVLMSSTASTNDAGLAQFTYQAPNNLTGLTSTKATLSFTENGITITKEIAINVNASAITTEYKLINENNITVNYAAQTQEVSIQLVKNGIPVAGEQVTAKSIPAAFGRIENATVTTGADGYARFTYIAADILTDGTQPLELVHTNDNGAEATTTVSIVIAGKLLYEFTNTSNITIEHGSQKEDVKAQLTYKGVPIAGKTVTLHSFSDGNGSILNGYSVTTDSVGYATFNYMAPLKLDDVNGTTLTLTMQFTENGNTIETNATVFFSETTDNVEGNVTLPNVVIPAQLREIILDSNSKTVEIPIKVFKDIAPYTQGSVKVELPQKVLNGTDVGQFVAYEVPVDNQGIATFSYTGPSNLQALIASDDNESIFKFYHTQNSADKQQMRVIYQLPPDPYISRNYALDIVTSGEFSMGIPEKEKTFNVLLKAKDSAGNDVSLTDENITRITALTTNSTIAQLLDTNTSNLVDSLELNAINNSPFILQSKKLSGLVPVQITVEFNDVNGDAQTLTTIVNVRVFSGPPSAISISYVSTGQDKERAKYIEKLAISVTDEYGNRVNTRPNISLGAIIGYAVDGSEATSTESNTSKRLFYGRDDIENGVANGTISNPDASNKATFSDPILSDVFKYVNAEGNNTDKLVVFGERKNYEAMGKWDIQTTGANDTLNLVDDYYGISRSGLYYAVGHNYYQDMCRQDGREWIGTTDSDTYRLDEEGTVTIDYKYDYHLTGKDALIWVNLDGIQPDTDKKIRIGEVTKHTLRGHGFTKVPTGGYSLKKGVSGVTVTFDIWHENAPERYRNGHFGWRIKEGSKCTIDPGTIISTNQYDARSCIARDGHAFVQMNISNPDPDADCSFDITGLVVSNEF